MGLNARRHGNSKAQVLRRVLHRPGHRARPERRRDPQPPVLRVGQQRVGRGQPDASRPRSSGSTTTARASCGRTRRPSSPRASTAPSYILYGLFRTNRTMSQIFWSDPAARRALGLHVQLGPDAGQARRSLDPVGGASRYYRSVIGNLDDGDPVAERHRGGAGLAPELISGPQRPRFRRRRSSGAGTLFG